MTSAGDDLLPRLPHRPPFLFVTRVIRVDASAAEAVWAVTGDEWFLRGHFPGRPIVPGVLIVEALAQVAGLVAGITVTGTGRDAAPPGTLGLMDVRFHETAVPPLAIALSAKLQKRVGRLWLFDVVAMTGPQRLASGQIALALDGLP